PPTGRRVLGAWREFSAPIFTQEHVICHSSLVLVPGHRSLAGCQCSTISSLSGVIFEGKVFRQGWSSAGILPAVMRASCPHVLRRDASATAAETAALRDNPVTSVTDRESAKKGARRDARFVVRCLVCRFQRQSYAEPSRRARRRQGCEGASIVPFDPAGHGSPDRGAGVAGRRAAHPAGRARSR